MLTDTQVRQARRRNKGYKLADNCGLYLYVSTSGGKSWRYDYRLSSRRQTVSLGAYPDVTLAQARERHREARRKVADGISPAAQKRRKKQAQALAVANSFRDAAEQWVASCASDRSAAWLRQSRACLDNDILPTFGNKPLREIEPADVLEAMRRFDARGAKTSAEKARGLISQIFRYSTLQAKELSAFLKAIECYQGEPQRRAGQNDAGMG